MRRTVDIVNQSDKSLDGNPGDSSNSAEAVIDLLHAVMHRVRSLQFQHLREGPDAIAPIAPMEAKVLGYFSRHPGHTQRDLAAHSGRDKAQVARLIKTLVERGWLQAAPSPLDGRQVQLTVTRAGQAVERALRKHRTAAAAKAMAGLGAADSQQLATLLRRLHDSLDADRL